MNAIDPYKVLQVLPTAEQEVLRAAFRALALKYHPDHDPSARAAQRMIELNHAYDMVRDAKVRAELDRSNVRAAGSFRVSAPVSGKTAPLRSAKVGTRLEQGRYAGWTLRDLAAYDPDYLRWLSRHSSGLRYRSEIMRILSSLGVAAA